MTTLLLDTSVIIDAVNEKKNRRQFLRDLVQQGNVPGLLSHQRDGDLRRNAAKGRSSDHKLPYQP